LFYAISKNSSSNMGLLAVYHVGLPKIFGSWV
jgi:hypothetical protein